MSMFKHVVLSRDDYDTEKYIAKVGNSYIKAVGGDGTLLRAINLYKHLNLPFYGIAKGSVNFLMNQSMDYETAKYKKFDLIKVKVTYENLERDMSGIDDHYVEREKEFQAFNDIMLGGDMNSWIKFNVHDKDRIIGEFQGGGIIVSTTQGSTGINKNNGGVILPLSSNNWSITGDKTNRKINYVIEPKRTTIEVTSRTDVTLWVDGQNHVIQRVKCIEISKGDQVTVMFNGYDEFKRKRRI